MRIINIFFLSIIFFYIKSVDFNEAMENLEILEEYIKLYYNTNKQYTITHLITCYIREGAYTGSSWSIAGGSIPSDLSQFIQTQDENEGTNVQSIKNYREIDLPNNEKFDFVHLFAVMNGIENGGSYSDKFAHLVGWGGDTFQLFQDIKDNQGTLNELIIIAKEFLGTKGGFGSADLISDLDAPILLQKKNDENYFANIIINYYTGEEYLNRVNNFLKITFPKLHYLDQFRKHIFNIYNDDFYIGVLECKNGLRKEGIGCVIPSNIKEEYKKNQKAAAYAFADFLSENSSGFKDSSFSFKLNVKLAVVIANLLLLL